MRTFGYKYLETQDKSSEQKPLNNSQPSILHLTLHRHEIHQDEHDHESTGSVVLAKRPLNSIVFVTALVGFLKERCLLRAQECFAGTASFAVCHIILDPSLLSLKEKNREQ